MSKLHRFQVSVFRTALGWMAIEGREQSLVALTFGHPSADSARQQINSNRVKPPRQLDWLPDLRKRLEDYAEGAPETFLDVDIAYPVATPLALAVLAACRQIAYGETLSYGNLAAQVGAPRAARAVGNVMRTNRCPLVIPCHRGVHGDGRIGNFSAAQGASMKERLLAMEAASQLLLLS